MQWGRASLRSVRVALLLLLTTESNSNLICSEEHEDKVRGTLAGAVLVRDRGERHVCAVDMHCVHGFPASYCERVLARWCVFFA